MTALQLLDDVTAAIALGMALLATASCLRDWRRPGNPVAPLRLLGALVATVAALFYAGTLLDVVEPFQHGPYVGRPIIIALLAVLAAEPMARRGPRPPRRRHG